MVTEFAFSFMDIKIYKWSESGRRGKFVITEDKIPRRSKASGISCKNTPYWFNNLLLISSIVYLSQKTNVSRGCWLHIESSVFSLSLLWQFDIILLVSIYLSSLLKKTDIYYAHINDLTRRLLPKMAYMGGSFQKRHLFHFTFLGNCPPTPPLTNINT